MDFVDKHIRQPERYRFLEKGGEMGRLILNYDWKKSPLGDIADWPQSLIVTLGNILHSNFPQFIFWGDDHTCLYNDAYRPSLGQDGKHPAIGKSGAGVWPEIWDSIFPLIESVRTTGKAVWFEDRLLPIYRNNRLEDVYWTFSYSPAFGDDGSICGVLVTCLETTKTVAASKEAAVAVSESSKELDVAHTSLLEANVYLQQIINSFKEPLQVLEPVTENGEIVDFRFKLTNEAYSAYAGTTPETLRNKKVGEVFPGYFHTTSFSNVVRTFLTGVANTWEIHYDQDGLDLYNEMSATKQGDNVVVHFTNFTRLKHLQLELEAKIEELQRSNRNLEEFANAASHDLKEPIRKIKVFTGQVREKLSQHINDSESLLFSKIENAAERMDQLIEDLMQYAHVATKPMARESVSLNQVLHKVMEDLELTILQKKAILTIGTLPDVKGYSRQLQQLFQNLISNSLKYCKADVHPEITIRSSVREESGKKFYDVEVKDNGIGFDQKYSEKIFDIFTRLHKKQDYSGNGIGLSIVKKIADNHLGKILVESELGKGSTFSLLLPF